MLSRSGTSLSGPSPSTDYGNVKSLKKSSKENLGVSYHICTIWFKKGLFYINNPGKFLA